MRLKIEGDAFGGTILVKYIIQSTGGKKVGNLCQTKTPYSKHNKVSKNSLSFKYGYYLHGTPKSN